MENTTSKIDTVQISTNMDNIGRSNIQDFKNMYKFVSKIPIIQKNDNIGIYKARVVLQPSYSSGSFVNYNTLTEYYSRLDEMLTTLYIKNKDAIKINRLDICIDFDELYEDLYVLGKVLLNMIDIYKFNLQFDFNYMGNARTNYDTYLRVGNDSFEVVFYDKQAESKGRHPFNSRIEFRFKRRKINKGGEVEVIKSLIRDLKQIRDADIYDMLEELYANRIVNIVKKNRSDLLEYLKNNRDEVITRESLKKAYLKVKKGSNENSFDNWYRKAKQRHKICCLKRKDIKDFLNRIIKSLEYFIRN